MELTDYIFTNLNHQSKIVFLLITIIIIGFKKYENKKRNSKQLASPVHWRKTENFGEYILLTNFSNYVKMFADIHKVKIVGVDKAMECATADNITIINFGMGSPGAATIMDLLSAINPKAFYF